VIGLTPEPRAFRGTALRGCRDGDVYLHPGEFAASAESCTISTILGSCVGVCLFDPEAQIG